MRGWVGVCRSDRRNHGATRCCGEGRSRSVSSDGSEPDEASVVSVNQQQGCGRKDVPNGSWPSARRPERTTAADRSWRRGDRLATPRATPPAVSRTPHRLCLHACIVADEMLSGTTMDVYSCARTSTIKGWVRSLATCRSRLRVTRCRYTCCKRLGSRRHAK